MSTQIRSSLQTQKMESEDLTNFNKLNQEVLLSPSIAQTKVKVGIPLQKVQDLDTKKGVKYAGNESNKKRIPN